MQNNIVITSKYVPLPWVAKKLNISQTKLRKMIENKLVKYGTYYPNNERNTYYIDSKKLFEETGIIYIEEDGNEESENE